MGTSGWIYDWNLGGSLDWFVKYSGLNAVELNASFYRFPFPNQVKGWAKKGSRIRWAIKVHRSITHYRRLSSSSLDIWKKFISLFEPLDPYIDFYLVQLPPSFVKNKRNIDRLIKFIEYVDVGNRLAIEFRDASWFNNETVELCESYSAVAVSIDSPIGTWIVKSGKIIYLRMHGKMLWYAHDYSTKELMEIVETIHKLKPEKTYVFFNNNHWMLENAREMLKLLTPI